MEKDLALRVLGPVEVLTGGGPAEGWGPAGARGPARPGGPAGDWSPAGDWRPAGTPQQRLVLAVMALRPGEVVPASELIDAVWEAAPPRSAPGSLHALVTRLRRILAGAGARIERRGPGYRLDLAPDRVDVFRFRSLAGSGRKEPDPGAAVRAFDGALALWRGPAVADVPDTAAVEAMRARLGEEHLSAVQDRVGRLLASGREREAIAEFPALLAAHPLAERLAAMYMVALFRCGQRAEALKLFRDLRRGLAAELGVEPGAELQRLHRSILAGVDLAVPPAGPAGLADLRGATLRGLVHVVPRQLPAGAAHFAGRAAELAALDRLVAPASESTGPPAGPPSGPPAGPPSGPPVIAVISGTAGVGKTALAVHWAHGVEEQFPDGQLYLNLKGFGPSGRPVPPKTAVRDMLAALAVPPGQIPASLDAQTAMYRSLLNGRRVLVLLDNARDVEQVRPLLPGSGGCLTLVTSRSQLTGLAVAEGASGLNLDVLSDADGRELLIRRLGARRVQAEPDAAAELAELCARLPLALAIAAARAASRPGLGLAALAAELRDRPGRLDVLATGDPASSVRDVLSWSYRQLGAAAAGMFRLIGVQPGPDISAPAAASLAGLPVPRARQLLAELTGAHLLTERAPGRFALHDLLRAYAAERARDRPDTADRETATGRLLSHYLHTATAASRLLYPVRDPLPLGQPPTGVTQVRLANRTEALAWLTAEHQALLAAAEAATGGGDAAAWQLPVALGEYLSRQGHWPDLAATQRAALAAARRLGDEFGQACAEHGIGTAAMRLHRYDESRRHLELAVGLFERLGERSREARSLISLGDVFENLGRYQEARRLTEQALRLYLDGGNRAGQGVALGNLGWFAAQLGDYAVALACCEEGIAIHREVGNALGEALAWDTLGFARHHAGDYTAAVGSYQHALGLLQDGSDRPTQADVLTRLGDSYQATGDQEAAGQAWTQALSILSLLHDPGAEQVRSRLSRLSRPGG